MQTYSEFRPSAFDSHIELEDRENWIVLPLAQTRDSDVLAYNHTDRELVQFGILVEVMHV